MVFYHKMGSLPKKRHTVFRNAEGALYHEELIGNEGFSGISSLLYHVFPPTLVRHAGVIEPIERHPSDDPSIRHRHFRTNDLAPGGDPISGRKTLLFNEDVVLEHARPTETADYLYRNGQADELIYICAGTGTLESVFGSLSFSDGDYLIVPRGIVYRLLLDPGLEHRQFIVESRGVIRTPKRYRNKYGQHIEGSPIYDRDIRVPEDLVTVEQKGEFEVRVKQRGGLHRYIYANHPFDAVGWDGYYYPWAYSIHDFEPIVGRIHQPPPVHQVFEGDNFVICNFCPRLYDFDRDAIAVPYNHTNAQSDEVIYYASAEFMSRRGIEFGSITLHPDGIAHGPQPGAVEAGLGATSTEELAVMVDTFRPLIVARDASAVEDPDYWKSWLGAVEG